MKHSRSKFGIVAVVFALGIATVAFAHGWNSPGYGGYMMGPGMMYGYGPGSYGHMWGYGPYGYGNLSQQDAARLEESQEKFFNETSGLRDAIQQKQFALDQELRQPNPNQDKVGILQQELSQLESEYQQKVVQHQLELRKNFPENALGMGYGRGGGYCW